MIALEIPVRRLPHAVDLPLPAYAHPGDAGLDLSAAIPDRLALPSLARVLVPTGFQVALPAGWQAEIRSRSGLALRHGLVVANSPGTIDQGFRGEVQVILLNLSEQDQTIERGQRIAQLVLMPAPQAVLHEVDSLPDSVRGSGGFGSTGLGER